MKNKKSLQHESLDIESLTESQKVILDTYAALMDANEFVWLDDLVEHLKESEFKSYWQRGEEWRQDRLLTDINSLSPSFFVEESGAEEDTFFMPMLWNPGTWRQERKK